MTHGSAGALSFDRSNWHAQAACLGRTGLFYSDDRSGQRAAVLLCLDCPVRSQCLDETRSIELPWMRYGVRAGLTASRRRREWDAG